MFKSDKYVKAAFVAKSIHSPYHIASFLVFCLHSIYGNKVVILHHLLPCTFHPDWNLSSCVLCSSISKVHGSLQSMFTSSESYMYELNLIVNFCGVLEDLETTERFN